MGFVQRTKDWYRGPYVPPPPPGRHIVFLTGHHEQPRLAQVLGTLGRFWLSHWQWIIGTGIAIGGLLAL